MSTKLENPFKNLGASITMKVWHKGHENCQKKYGYDNCKKDTITFKMPDILDTKVDDFCQRHQTYFDNELHRFPSGNIKWIGCPICKINDKKFRDKADFIYVMQEAGMRLNQDTKEWFMPGEPGEETLEKGRYKSVGFKRD
jgi:hypothetical protein